MNLDLRVADFGLAIQISKNEMIK